MSQQKIAVVTVGREGWEPGDDDLAAVSAKFAPVREAGYIVVVVPHGVDVVTIDADADTVRVPEIIRDVDEAEEIVAGLLKQDAEETTEPTVEDVVGGAALDAYLDDVKQQLRGILAGTKDSVRVDIVAHHVSARHGNHDWSAGFELKNLEVLDSAS